MTADAYPSWSEVREVGPRDGLQNEAPIPVEARIDLIDALSATGACPARLAGARGRTSASR